MTKQEEIRAEKIEIETLLDKGATIEVDVTTYKRKRGIFGLLQKRERVVVREKHVIKQPTLAVLDLIASEQILLNIDESEMASEQGMQRARTMAKEQCMRMARIVAMAIIGEDYFQFTGKKYVHADKELDRLSEMLYHNVKPSLLLKYCIFINTMSNLGDFINSIRLMSAARTTMPIRVEEKAEG